jgi:hypothetical protein
MLKVTTFNIPGTAFETPDGAAREGAESEEPPQQSGKPISSMNIARRMTERFGCERRASVSKSSRSARILAGAFYVVPR